MPTRLRQPDPERSWGAFWKAFDDPDPEARARAPIIAGKLLRELGDLDAAQNAYRKATSSRYAAVVADGWNLLGGVLRAGHDYSGASEAYENAIKAGVPRIAHKAAYNRGLLLWSENRPEAEDVFRAAMSADDPDVPAWAAYSLGDWLVEHGQAEDAEAAYRAAITLDHPGASPKAMIALADLLGERGENEEAEEFLRRATTSPETDDTQAAWLQLGQLLVRSGDLSAALASLEACARGPNPSISSTSALLRAQLLAKRADQPDWELIRGLLEDAASNGTPPVAAAASYQLGTVDLGAERRLDALLQFVASVRTAPSSAALVDLALVIKHHSSIVAQEALQAVAASADPSVKIWALRGLADLQASVGANDAAIESYRTAFELKNDQSELAGAALAVQLAERGEVADAEKVVNELNSRRAWTPLERAMLAHRMRSIEDEQLRSLLGGTRLLALGQAAPSEEGTDLLHFAIDDADGEERIYLPLFTRLDIVHDAVVRNLSWFQLAVLEVEAEAVMSNIAEDVTAVVLNPWSALEVTLNRVRQAAPSAN